MSASKLDTVYRRFQVSKFFTKGWGKPENLRRLFEFRKVVSNRDKCFKLIEKDYPVTITKEQKLSDCTIFEGYFQTPLERYLPGIVPEIAQKAHFQVILPIKWTDPTCKPVCLHLAGTGDHFFWRRRNLMVRPLLREAGIGGIILENPFYGLRKPVDQVRSSLQNVSDIFVMGGCLMLEALVLFHWCERNGLGPLGVTGLSMGGHMASLAATNWPKPLVLVPCLSWSTASAVFLQGVLARSINWDLLEDQYFSDGVYREKLFKMVTVIDEAFLAGKKFVQSYSQNIDNVSIGDPSIKNDINSGTTDYEHSITKEKVNISKNDEETQSNEKRNVAETINAGTVNIDELRADTVNTGGEGAATLKTEETKADAVITEDLNTELAKLLEEKKITKQLYDKLMSNTHFELELQDIEIINKLNKEKTTELKYTLAQTEETHEKSILIENKVNDNNGTELDERSSDDSTDKSRPPVNDDKPATDTKEGQNKSEKKTWNVSDMTSDLLINIPFLKSPEKKIDICKVHWRDRETLQFMRGIMDECTHLSNFSVPYDTSLIIAVCAKHDAYVPREDVGALEEIWPGAEVRYVDAGHVSAYLLHQSLFRSCIKEAFERSKKKWNNGKHVD